MMKVLAIALVSLAALPLAACGGSSETTNTVVTENLVDDGVLNGAGPTDESLGNVALDNDATLNSTDLNSAAPTSGNSLTPIDNSQ